MLAMKTKGYGDVQHLFYNLIRDMVEQVRNRFTVMSSTLKKSQHLSTILFMFYLLIASAIVEEISMISNLGQSFTLSSAGIVFVMTIFSITESLIT